jgi:hypothetical protein
MKTEKNIHSLDTLEMEIYRLKLEAKNMEEKLSSNLDYLQENYLSMTINSFSGKNENKDERNSFWKNFIENESIHSAINTIAGNIAEKAAEGVNRWVNATIEKNKHKE